MEWVIRFRVSQMHAKTVDSDTLVTFVKEMATQTHILHLIGHTVFPAAGVNINDRGILQKDKDRFTDTLKSKGLLTKERI